MPPLVPGSMMMRGAEHAEGSRIPQSVPWGESSQLFLTFDHWFGSQALWSYGWVVRRIGSHVARFLRPRTLLGVSAMTAASRAQVAAEATQQLLTAAKSQEDISGFLVGFR